MIWVSQEEEEQQQQQASVQIQHKQETTVRRYTP
jgi:hypothetical protein